MSQKSRKICVFLPNWIGDVIMSTPSLRLMHDCLGDNSTFTIVSRPNILELLEGNPWIDDRIPFEPRGNRPEFHQASVVRQLRQGHFDSIVFFSNSLRSATVAWLAGVKRRIGYRTQCRSFLLTHRLRKPQGDIPLVDYFLNIADQAIGILDASAPQTNRCLPGRQRLELYTTPEEEELGDQIWKNLGLQAPEKVIVLNIGSMNHPTRFWPIDHAAGFSRLVTEKLGMDVLLNCGPGEAEMARETVERSKSPRVFSMADQPASIHTGKICLKRARLTVSTDSGPLHMALAFGNPAIVLLGPTSKSYIANPTADLTILSRDLPCAPCRTKKHCPLKHQRCMKEITPESVYEKVVDVLGRPAPVATEKTLKTY